MTGRTKEAEASPPAAVESSRIREVWASNLEEEFKEIRNIVKQYTYVAMDTEFPGVVARPIGEFKSREDYQYQLLRCNVDLLRLIQVGLSFFDQDGKLPEPTCTWQFNFKFNLTEDMYAQDSVDLLQNSGIQFRRLADDGIDVTVFAELLMTSGLVLQDNVTWLSFHSGYDFGYLMKLLTNTKLSKDQREFTELLHLFFPHIYDIKNVILHMSPHFQAMLSGGLQEIADNMKIKRIGRSHQAGSDSLLTGSTFFNIKERFFDNDWTAIRCHEQKLYGLTAMPALSAAGKENRAPSPSNPVGPASVTVGPSALPYEAQGSGKGGLIDGANGVNVPPGLGSVRAERESSSASSSTASDSSSTADSDAAKSH